MTNVEIAKALNRSYGSVQGYLQTTKVRSRVVKRRNLAPFLSMEKTTLAYIAGLVDGEGTITLGSPGRCYLQPQLYISNTSQLLAEWLRERGFHVNHSRNGKQRPWWKLYMTGWNIIEPLRALSPYLVIKRRHADLMIECIEIRLTLPHRYEPSERMLSILHEIRELNRRLPTSHWIQSEGQSASTI